MEFEAGVRLQLTEWQLVRAVVWEGVLRRRPTYLRQARSDASMFETAGLSAGCRTMLDSAKGEFWVAALLSH